MVIVRNLRASSLASLIMQTIREQNKAAPRPAPSRNRQSTDIHPAKPQDALRSKPARD
ncbi:hypothetical protein [Sneathiella chinensis]|uniref:Uncharacterized protein n=1 Tax=Sneathiella chinensis TaxID=349750 RepID=A0ABQ5U2K6_9PROT|nr:hypothetical protein [Sneathiella chinensis]GLQ05499.1 hypothetical protein GCM10007924_07200 [Sneathiella chinensis]